MRRTSRVQRVFLLVAALGVAASAARADSHRCFFFMNEEGIPVVHLDAAAIDSVGAMISNRNVELVDRIDEGFRAGRYGEPGKGDTRKHTLVNNLHRCGILSDTMRGKLEEELRVNVAEHLEAE